MGMFDFFRRFTTTRPTGAPLAETIPPEWLDPKRCREPEVNVTIDDLSDEEKRAALTTLNALVATRNGHRGRMVQFGENFQQVPKKRAPVITEGALDGKDLLKYMR